jgi:hypothetical protein
MGLFKMIFGKRQPSDIFDFERDYAQAMKNSKYQGENPTEEAVFIGTANRKNVFIPSDAKHVFICGTTGSGKTVALANFLAAGANYNYPMLIVDGKGLGKMKCPRCDATGVLNGKHKCYHCQGERYVLCTLCRGKGKID